STPFLPALPLHRWRKPPKTIRTDTYLFRISLVIMIRYLLLVSMLSIVSGNTLAKDKLEAIKDRLSSAVCTEIEFISIIESEIFDQSDSLFGDLLIAKNGSYRVTLGSDQYWFHSGLLYSYSGGQGQVTVESIDENDQSHSQISFITRLDKYYETKVLKRDQSFRLTLHSREEPSLPDSVILSLAGDSETIERLEYFDINDELNRFVILKMKTMSECDDKRFVPDYPDSTEVIKLN
ncbi:MAG: hypothetical protein V3T31_09450, partial [candidate division Zixibacteria bacterium]